ncbi:mating type pheromone [Serpula lacrymans var. lacrymans S7.9]|uniref:Mating type pheromone n=1 Tax=Serpula lacrymans var. lacrymans (strain S7.9) TaxID=578457 RepID=F8NKI8_SERL9|nr:mating type pheromone [Serpula lacrymans var. lacrymans S7.9]EGO28926.1 mating type pheromone [Serpula lacrymans var. lacrymans S7.9]
MDSFTTLDLTIHPSETVHVEQDPASIPVNEDTPWRPGTYCVIA